jgi:hypothetical protein
MRRLELSCFTSKVRVVFSPLGREPLDARQSSSGLLDHTKAAGHLRGVESQIIFYHAEMDKEDEFADDNSLSGDVPSESDSGEKPDTTDDGTSDNEGSSQRLELIPLMTAGVTCSVCETIFRSLPRRFLARNRNSLSLGDMAPSLTYLFAP